MKLGYKLNFLSADWMDVDSTVQEANMSYPSDANLMKKLVLKGVKVLKAMREKGLENGLRIDKDRLLKKAQEYFFLTRTASKEKRRAIFKDYHELVCEQIVPFIKHLKKFSLEEYKSLNHGLRRAIDEMRGSGLKYLQDVRHFIETHNIKPCKRLCFHLSSVACIRKGKWAKRMSLVVCIN